MNDIHNDPDLIHDRAVALFNLGRQNEALLELDRALELQPDYSYRYASRAYMRNALKDIHGAISDYRKAIELDPEDAVALNNLGLLEEQLGYHEEARERYKVADELMGILDANKIAAHMPNVPAAEGSERGEKRVTMADIQAPDASEQGMSEENSQKPSTVEIAKEMGAVFTRKGRLKEFFRFVFNGFKLDEPKHDNDLS